MLLSSKLLFWLIGLYLKCNVHVLLSSYWELIEIEMGITAYLGFARTAANEVGDGRAELIADL